MARLFAESYTTSNSNSKLYPRLFRIEICSAVVLLVIPKMTSLSCQGEKNFKHYSLHSEAAVLKNLDIFF